VVFGWVFPSGPKKGGKTSVNCKKARQGFSERIRRARKKKKIMKGYRIGASEFFRKSFGEIPKRGKSAHKKEIPQGGGPGESE